MSNPLSSFPIGLGCMAMSGMYGPADETESIATIHAALDRGITLLDTGDFYGMGHNEMLIGRALAGGKRDGVFIQVKFGAQRDPAGAWLGYDARPAAVKTALAYTLRRLNTDHIDLYQPARLDPKVPIEETVGAIAEMIAAGYVRHVGLSEMGPETIRRANAAHRVTSLQLEYSLMSRGIETAILPALRELGMVATVYGVLSRGLLGGKRSEAFGAGDIRHRMPRWSGANETHNLAIVDRLAEIAREKNATTPQLALAWVLSRGSDIVPLAGARTRAQLSDLLGALDLRLSDDDLFRIEAAVPAAEVAGTRYDQHQMAVLDSER
ncbi:MAG TPA: aldo/keto reductase [Candidatus Elarobacter sp.]|jgi:aryl-alcohol dehydrogenase-like predicted oxidoreductase|nr:aldo/keto reductase [Candidatus Elarobacter sp.]